MDKKDARDERNIFAYDFREFLTEKEALEHAGKLNRWKMPAGQRKIFQISREVLYPEILYVKKVTLAFNFDECEGGLMESVRKAKKIRSFMERRTKIFTISKELPWPEAAAGASQELGKRIIV